MVTANVNDLADEFDTIVQERDVGSVATLGIAGAGGGVIATQIVNRLAPKIGLDPSLDTPRENVGIGLVKMLIGVGLGYAGVKVGGTGGTLAAVAGLGTLVLGGGDWLNLLFNQAGVGGSAPRVHAQSTSGNSTTARVVSSSTSSSQPTATPTNNDDVQFRATADGSGGPSPKANGQFR